MATRTVSNAGGNWNATTTWVGGVVPIAGDDVNFTATSGNLTVNVSTANLVGIDFTNYVGTITFNNNINTNGTVNLGTGGYTQAGVSGLNINGNATISGSTVWNNLTLSSTLTLTLSSNLTVTNLTAAASSNISFTLGGNILSVTGTLTIFNVTNFNTPSNLQVTNLVIGNGSGSGNININGSFTISVSGNLTENRGGTSVCSGNTSIELNGTGTWSNTSTGALRNNLTINSPSGTITVSGNVYYNTGVLTYTSGTVNTAVSTLIIGASTTLDTDRGSTKITWNNVTIAIITTAVITLSSNLDITGTTTLQATATTLSFALSFAGVGIFNPSGALVINNSTTSATTFTITIPSVLTVTNLTLAVITSTNNSIITLNTNSINVTGNLTVGTSANTLTILGTTSINLTGTGIWSHSSGGILRNNLTINSPSGTITVSGTVNYNTGTLTYTAGTVTTTSSTLNIGASTTIDTDRGATRITWNNVTITTGTITLSSNLTVGGTLTLTGTMTGAFTITTVNLTTGSAAINVTSTSVTGNLTINGSTSGTLITLNGIGSQTWSHGSAVNLSNSLTINKSSGTLTIGTNVYYITGTLTYTAGIVDTTTNSSTLNIGGSTTLNTNSVTWNNVTITTGTITLTSNFVMSNTLTIGTTSNQTITFSGVGVLSPTITCNLSIPSNSRYTTLNLPYDITVNNFTFSVNVAGGGVQFTLNNSTINILGDLSLIQSASNAGYYLTGTGSLAMIGNGTWSSTYQPFRLSASWYNYISLNMTFNTTGIINIVGSVGYGFINNGISLSKTITYISGTINATSSILWVFTSLSFGSVQGVIFNTNTMMWGSIYQMRSGGASNSYDTLTLLSDLNMNGTLYFWDMPFSNSLGFIINGGYNINMASLLVGHGGGVLTGTATFVFNKTGSWVHNTAISVSNNIIIDTLGTLTISGNVYYNTRTLRYITGNVDTTGSTLNVTASSTLNTSGMTWSNVTLVGTQTLTTGLNVGGNLTTQTTAVVLSGVVNVNVGGNLAINIATSGTATIILNGTGAQTWSHGSAVYLSTNLTINKSAGTLTLGTNIYYGTGILLYTAGVVDTTTNNNTLFINASTTLDTDRGATKISWNNITTSGTTLTITLSSDLTVNNTLTFAHSGTLTFSLGIYTLNFANNLVVTNGTTTLPTNFNVVNATLINSTTNAVLNGFTINISGNLTTTSTGICSGTTNLVLTGTGIWSNSSTGQIRNNLTINATAITVSGTVYYNTGILTYTAGTVNTSISTLVVGASTTLDTDRGSTKITWNNVILAGTQTLSSGLNMTGNLTTQSTAVVLSGVVNVNVGGNLAINIATSGTATIILNSTGAQTWSHGSAVYLSTNLTINKSTGILTVSGSVYYFGIMTYIPNLSSVTTTNSTLFIGGSTTLNTTGITWFNINVSVTCTVTFVSDVSLTNLYIFTNAGTNGTVTFSGVYNFNISGTLEISNATAPAVTTTFNLSNTINTNNLIIRTGSNGVGQGSVTTINNNTIYASGNFTFTFQGGGGAFANLIINGTTNIIMNGTGTLSSNYTGENTYYFRSNLSFDTTGVITVSGVIPFGLGTLSYVQGTVNVSGATLYLKESCTVNTSILQWATVVIYPSAGYTGSNTVTMLSDLRCLNLNAPGGTISFSVTAGTLNVSNDLYCGNTVYGQGAFAAGVVLNLPNELRIQNMYRYTGHYTTPWTSTINNHKIYINGNITIAMANGPYDANLFTPHGGTTVLEIVGDCTYNSYNSAYPVSNILRYVYTQSYLANDIIFNTRIPIKFLNRFQYATGTITVRSSTKIIGTPTVLNPKANQELYLFGNTTLKSIDKIVFLGALISAGSTITTDSFFNGSPSTKTTVSSTTTANYTITFQDRTEKFAKFVKVNRATLSVPGQLTVITDKGNQGNNVGIVFAPNQKSNGLPKNTPSVLESTYGSNSLLTDPTLNLV